MFHKIEYHFFVYVSNTVHVMRNRAKQVQDQSKNPNTHLDHIQWAT